MARLAGGGDQTDDALANPQPGAPDRLRPQPLGRAQFQQVAGQQHVQRAHLAHHLGRDQVGQRRQRHRLARHQVAVKKIALRERPAPPPAAAGPRPHGLIHECGDDGRDRLHVRHHADRLAGHDAALLDVALDHGAAQRPGPEVLDRELRRLLGQLAGGDRADHLQLVLGEPLAAGVGEAPHRDHRETRVELHRRQRVAGRGADEGALKIGVGDALDAGGEPCAKLGTGRSLFEETKNRLAPAEPAGHEHRHVADVGQHLLRQHRQADRADVAAGLAALDHQRVGAGSHQPAGQHQRRSEAHDSSAAVFDRANGTARR